MSADFALTRNFKLSDAATTKCMLFCFGLWVKNIENIYPTSCISHISTNYPPASSSAREQVSEIRSLFIVRSGGN